MSVPTVVLLVDHKARDLYGSALIAKHLRDAGVACHLEPINAWQGVLGAYQPNLILFNHVNRDHLAAYTARLHELGVLTAILPNEGILYEEEVRNYNSRRVNDNLHLDYYFCWNTPHQTSLLKNGFAGRTNVETVGVPRFDFYFEPWSRVFCGEQPALRPRPRILLCTNFGLAEFKTRPREMTERFFGEWSKELSIFGDYWNAIEVHHRSRLRCLEFLQAIVEAGRFDVVLRTHPRENREVYEQWLEKLPPASRRNISYPDTTTQSITSMILDCDLEISCERCTTALESWIARKPTIELIFEKHPLFYDHHVSTLNPNCESPQNIVAEIDRQLADPVQGRYVEGRQKHLALWCHSPDGGAAKRLADFIIAAIKAQKARKTFSLGFHDYRRGLKLKACHLIGEPYTYPPLQKLKRRLWRGDGGFNRKLAIYEKSVKPGDVSAVLASLEHCQNGDRATKA